MEIQGVQFKNDIGRGGAQFIFLGISFSEFSLTWNLDQVEGYPDTQLIRSRLKGSLSLVHCRPHGIVVMDFDCYTGDRGSIPTQLTAIHLASELTFARVNPCLVREIWVVSLRCRRHIDLHRVYNCENRSLSFLQFNHIEIEIRRRVYFTI